MVTICIMEFLEKTLSLLTFKNLSFDKNRLKIYPIALLAFLKAIGLIHLKKVPKN